MNYSWTEDGEGTGRWVLKLKGKTHRAVFLGLHGQTVTDTISHVTGWWLDGEDMEINFQDVDVAKRGVITYLLDKEEGWIK